MQVWYSDVSNHEEVPNEENEEIIDDNDAVLEDFDVITFIVDIHDQSFEAEKNEENKIDNADILCFSNKKDIADETAKTTNHSKSSHEKTIDDTSGVKLFSCKMCDYKAVKKFDIT